MVDFAKTELAKAMREEKIRRQTVRGLADVLAVALHITRFDSTLVWCLGAGDENTNIDALRVWVDGNLDEIDTGDGEEVFDVLRRRLQQQLERETEMWGGFQ